jgi:hypothetical protein
MKQCVIVLVTVAAALVGVGSLSPVLGEGIPLDLKQTAHCSVFAPSDWNFVSNAQASTAEADNADHTLYAG